MKKYIVTNERFDGHPVQITFAELVARIAELTGDPAAWNIPEGIRLVETERGIETDEGELVAIPS